MKIITWDSGVTWDNLNARWGDSASLLDADAWQEWYSVKTRGGAVGRVCPAKNRAPELNKPSPPDRPAFGA
ncbi:MAG TPA: hypothetical protein PK490_15745 [Prosthecobacter sp.]|nr:hypothetical protein [Prosthecobacter sp.]